MRKFYLFVGRFGPDERTLATGICTTANNMGIPVAFLLALFVTDRDSFFYMYIPSSHVIVVFIVV